MPRKLAVLLLLALLLSCQPQEGTVVTRVVDGDTIRVRDSSGQEYPVRYIGIDTPEVSGGVECYGREATARNRQLVESKRVRLEKDVSETDRFGRLLRYVYVNGTFVNARLVEEGYARARAYPPDVKYKETFAQLEREAKGKGAGLWGECQR